MPDLILYANRQYTVITVDSCEFESSEIQSQIRSKAAEWQQKLRNEEDRAATILALEANEQEDGTHYHEAGDRVLYFDIVPEILICRHCGNELNDDEKTYVKIGDHEEAVHADPCKNEVNLGKFLVEGQD